MRITSFQLLNHHITVTYPESIHADGEDVLGYCEPVLNRMRVATIDPQSREILPAATLSHSYYHELVHYMFFLCGRMDLFHNERLVDMMGGLLAQHEYTKRLQPSASSSLSHPVSSQRTDTPHS